MGNVATLPPPLPEPPEAPEWRDPVFDAALDDEYPPLDVYGQTVNIADALAVDQVAYEQALAEWRAAQREQLDEEVASSFPLPIAHCYRRFVRGNPDPLKRLHAAGDTWEAAIHLLHAMVLGELRQIDGIVEGRAIKRGWLDAQTLRERIELCRLVLDWAGTELPVCSKITKPVLAWLVDLISVRNGFSHRAQPTEAQAQNTINEVEPLLVEILSELRWLSAAKLFQPVGSKRFQVYSGHSTDQEFSELKLSKQERLAVAQRGDAGQEVFLRYEQQLFSLHPIIIPRGSATAHQSHLAFLKKRDGRSLIYEIFGCSEEVIHDEPACLAELNELKQRFIND